MPVWKLHTEFIHRETSRRIPDGIKLKITVWETGENWVEYSEAD